MTSDHRIYVMLGFHASFHHSWRGDTPDEAGFGTDIRIVRRILDILDRANEEGLQARGYWDWDVYWTLQEIVPRHAPDIIERLRQRVEAGQDEIVLGPYNNGANHAATGREFRAALRYALENPYGSGLKQLFGRVAPVLRPQESMYTAGQNAILLEEGISGLVLYYSGIPFNALSTFLPVLPPQQRYNTLWLRSQPGEPSVVLWPCISPGDLVEHVSLEKLLLDLRRLQTSGRVRSDLLVHVNFDADAETWLPVGVPRAFSWFPNTGGLAEYVDVVNRYPWASFTVPTEYARDHEPQGEILVRQDLADGGFDGNYSWAEKCTSLKNWTALEQSRLHTYRAEALARRLPPPLADEIHCRLWEGEDSVFFRRLVGLTTTHFGMSTPVINEERQTKARALLGGARDRALEAERRAALALRDPVLAAAAASGPAASPSDGARVLYTVEVFAPLVEGHPPAVAHHVIRLPVILPPGVAGLRVEDVDGASLPASLLHPPGMAGARSLPDGSRAGELVFCAALEPGSSRLYHVLEAPAAQDGDRALRRLRNCWLELRLSERFGVESLAFEGQEVGGERFLEPFITYRHHRRPQRWVPAGYELEDLAGEAWDGLCRARLRAPIVMDTPHGPATSELCYTFTLFDDLPYLLVDVDVSYARTPPTDTIHTPQQKLRRLLDLGWIEVAPCQLNPALTAPSDRPLRVWKHNYLGITAHYDLDYGRHNPRNRDLDSFNHQVTAGWLAIGDGRTGLLLAQSAAALVSMAFCPMRLRERQGVQYLSLNPFGSYHGRQPDYRHLGGSGVGAAFTVAASGSLRPNGPSFNGQRLAFSLLLAPYVGDEPPPSLQADALAHFYPAGAIYHRVPAGVDAVLPADLWQRLAAAEQERQRASNAPLLSPDAFLANPSDGAADLVWDPPRDARLAGYELRWRGEGDGAWQEQLIPPASRWQVAGLQNGRRYRFQVRGLAGKRRSAWTAPVEAVPGVEAAASIFAFVPAVSPATLLRMVGRSLAHVLSAWLRR